MEQVRFLKMSGAGNDFIVVSSEELDEPAGGLEPWIRAICRRRTGIGADGVVIVSPSAAGGEIGVRFHNPDGSEAFCGNGTRCAARFASLRGYGGDRLRLATLAGPVPARILRESVRLELPPPRDLGELTLEAGGTLVHGRRIDSGAPHFVIRVPSVRSAPLETWGPEIRRAEPFGAAGTNVDVASVRVPGEVAVRTWERGVEGETLACGTGAVAVALAVSLEDGESSVRIMPAGGIPLTVILEGPAGDPTAAILEGDATVVFEGRLGEGERS